ncbi:MAG TPA: PilZ domain-containing protein [Allosphingosinicella sp.]|nr:PilZ domain-containing protein [Allosphingosinicella sp.]
MHEFRSSILSGPADRPATPVAAKKAKGSGGLGGLTAIAVKRQETRVTNQRSEDRLRDIVEETVMVFRRKKVGARVINVSSRGAMIEAEVEARIGEKIDLLFADKNKTRCVVRWVREGRMGVEFLNETIFWDSAQTSGPVFRSDDDERSSLREVTDREPRHTLLRSGTLYWSGISIPVRLRNISTTGARIESEQALRPGVEVELDLGEAGFQYAEVRWAKDGQIGLRFAAEFDLDSLAPSSAAANAPKVASNVLKPAYLETETQADSPWAARFERLSLTDLKAPDKG